MGCECLAVCERLIWTDGQSGMCLMSSGEKEGVWKGLWILGLWDEVDAVFLILMLAFLHSHGATVHPKHVNAR